MPVRFDERAGRDDLWTKAPGRRTTAKAFPHHAGWNLQLFGDSVLAEARLGSTATEQEALAILERMDLAQYAQAHPLALSGGQKQRLAIVDGCLSGKELLIFDEPTSGLDYAHMLEVSRLLRELAKQGLCVVVITHDGEFLRESGAQTVRVEAKEQLNSICITTEGVPTHGIARIRRVDYLEAILVLHRRWAWYAPWMSPSMEVSKPSVCHAVATLREGGFLTMERLFPATGRCGSEVAEQIYEKHRFFYRPPDLKQVWTRKRRNRTPAGWSTLSAMSFSA